jgi:hypothetical protein
MPASSWFDQLATDLAEERVSRRQVIARLGVTLGAAIVRAAVPSSAAAIIIPCFPPKHRCSGHLSNTCCGPHERCCEGEGGSRCCKHGETCCNGRCCDRHHFCAHHSVCCKKGQKACASHKFVKCCPPDKHCCVGADGFVDCCARGEVCRKGRCCRPDEVCDYNGIALCCQGGKKCCGGNCVDVQSDPKNCGACGHTCHAGQGCAGGACTGGCTSSSDCLSRQICRGNPPKCTCFPGQVVCASSCGCCLQCALGESPCGDLCAGSSASCCADTNVCCMAPDGVSGQCCAPGANCCPSGCATGLCC